MNSVWDPSTSVWVTYRKEGSFLNPTGYRFPPYILVNCTVTKVWETRAVEEDNPCPRYTVECLGLDHGRVRSSGLGRTGVEGRDTLPYLHPTVESIPINHKRTTHET